MKKTPRAPVIKAHVTRDIIEQGRIRDSGYCMLAEAVKAAFPDGIRVAADLQTIRISHPQRRLRYIYLTPRVAQIALIEFDQGSAPEPFDIRLSNGQVTRMGMSSTKVEAAKNLLTEDERNKRRKQMAAARAVGRVRLSNKHSGSTGTVPDKIGGKPPPVAPLSRRRAFGLRGLMK